MSTFVPCKKNDTNGFIFYIALISQANTKLFQVNPTLAAGDAKVSIDGAATANLGTLPAVTPAAGRMVKVTLSQAEVNGDNIQVFLSDAAGAEWCDLAVNIQTVARQIDDLATPTNITAGVITTVTNLTNAPTSGDLTATMKTSVNTEVVDALNVDTYAEPGQGAPAATTTLAAKLNYLYKVWRNKKTQTATTYSLFNDDAATVDQKATVSDDGTTATKGEVASGP